eukprot:7892719-Pyramimonas_sp.AAC.1
MHQARPVHQEVRDVGGRTGGGDQPLTDVTAPRTSTPRSRARSGQREDRELGGQQKDWMDDRN